MLDRMVKIKGGVFIMGDDYLNKYLKNCPVHEVELDDFELQSTPVTQTQYKAVMGENPSLFKNANNPVENVTWWDSAMFCEKLSKFTLLLPYKD